MFSGYKLVFLPGKEFILEYLKVEALKIRFWYFKLITFLMSIENRSFFFFFFFIIGDPLLTPESEIVSCCSSRLVTNCNWSRINCYILWVSSCLVACFSNQNLSKKKNEFARKGMKVVCYQLNFEFQAYLFQNSQSIGYFHESKGKVH